ncbi:hypothetical protein RMCBS344292_05116 [Rhizopus microsporus]|nr:hypothetical protein RMCBS344292_05116 [Rhizopus microsporus]
MNSNAVNNNNIVNLVQDDFKDMNIEFSERFGVDCEYTSIPKARSVAADFGKKNGTLFLLLSAPMQRNPNLLWTASISMLLLVAPKKMD